ncbi:MAG: hypothetical protein ACR2JU_01485 [Nocardioidaceae bacterium]
MRPIASDVAAFLGMPGDSGLLALAEEHLPVVTAMVRGYPRGRGFTAEHPADDLALIILSATARLTANPDMTTEVSIDDYSRRQAIFNGFTLPELAVLHNYRRRAA